MVRELREHPEGDQHVYVSELVLPLRAFELEDLLHALARDPTARARLRHATTVDEVFEQPSPTGE